MSNAALKLNPEPILGTPSRICGLPNRDLCVVDSHNHCLWVLDRSGKVKYKIGTGEKGHKDGHLRDAEFNSPQSAAVFHNSLFVVDSGNQLVREVSLTNAAVSSITKSPKNPIDVYEFNEKLFILSSGSSIVTSFDPIRNHSETAFQTSCKQMIGLATNGEQLFFTDLATNSILSWDGKKTYTLFTAKSTAELNKPMSLSYSGNNLYIADTYNHQIKLFSLNSKTLTTLIGTGKAGNGCGDFAKTELKHPTNVFISGMSLFICDRGNNEIKIADFLQNKVQSFHVRR